MSKRIEATRARILAATAELLEAGSPGAVTMADIAKRAGITRQALYLHFANRAELLIATVQHIDKLYDVDALLEPSRQAKDGADRLDKFIDAWLSYLPRVAGIVKGLIAVYETDEAAAAAWDDRRAAIRHGCEAAVRALKKDGLLTLPPKDATDTLSGLVSFELWEFWIRQCGWSNRKCIRQAQRLARAAITSL